VVTMPRASEEKANLLFWIKGIKRMPRRARSREDGYCLIYEENRKSPIGEVKTQGVAERIVLSLWDKYGPRFHRSEPTAAKRMSGSDGRLRQLSGANPIHAVVPGTDKKLCGGKFRSNFGDFAEPGSGKVTCEFCLAEIDSANSAANALPAKTL